MIRIASLTLLAGGVLLITWTLAPAGARQRRPDVAATSAIEPYRAAEPMLAEVSAEVARLRTRLDRVPEFGRPTRDPFRLGARSATPAPVEAATVVAPPPAPVLPRLVAILSDNLAATPVHRAAIAVDGVVRILAVGDMVGALRVSRIDANGIDLVDPATGATHHLTLR